MGLFKKKCKTYRCPNLHTNVSGFCDRCQAERSADSLHKPIKGPRVSSFPADSRPSATKRGYDHSWHKFSREFLQVNPTCEICGRPAQCVDHKTIPAEIMMDLYGKFDLDPGLYQALCYSCNRRKTIQDRDQVDRYFADKERISQGTKDPADPQPPRGEGSKLPL